MLHLVFIIRLKVEDWMLRTSHQTQLPNIKLRGPNTEARMSNLLHSGRRIHSEAQGWTHYEGQTSSIKFQDSPSVEVLQVPSFKLQSPRAKLLMLRPELVLPPNTQPLSHHVSVTKLLLSKESRSHTSDDSYLYGDLTSMTFICGGESHDNIPLDTCKTIYGSGISFEILWSPRLLIPHRFGPSIQGLNSDCWSGCGVRPLNGFRALPN